MPLCMTAQDRHRDTSRSTLAEPASMGMQNADCKVKAQEVQGAAACLFAPCRVGEVDALDLLGLAGSLALPGHFVDSPVGPEVAQQPHIQLGVGLGGQRLQQP